MLEWMNQWIGYQSQHLGTFFCSADLLSLWITWPPSPISNAKHNELNWQSIHQSMA
jgi:hypothetical protein